MLCVGFPLCLSCVLWKGPLAVLRSPDTEPVCYEDTLHIVVEYLAGNKVVIGVG